MIFKEFDVNLLWCRYVNLNIKNTKLLFRDYAQPFIHLNEFHIWGYFMAAEIAPSFCALRDIVFKLDESGMKFKMQRSINALKFYQMTLHHIGPQDKEIDVVHIKSRINEISFTLCSKYPRKVNK